MHPIIPFRGSLGKQGWHRSALPGVSLSAHLSDAGLHITSLWVHPDQRGQGAATRLMRELIALGKPIQLTALAEDPRRQTRLVRWYRRLGFSGPEHAMTYTPAVLNILETRNPQKR